MFDIEIWKAYYYMYINPNLNCGDLDRAFIHYMTSGRHNGNFLFVPRRLPNLSRKWRELGEKFGDRLIFESSTAFQVEYKNQEICISHSRGNYVCDNLFVGINVLDLSSIEWINIPLKDFIVVDHIQVKLGLIRKEDLPVNEFIISRKRGGYVSSYLKSKNSILMWRPYHGSVKKFDAADINFGLSKWRIILSLLVSFRYSRILEAFFTKFGLFPKSKYYTLFLQSKIKFEEITDSTRFSQKKIYNVLSEYGLNKLIATDGKVIYGNHQMGEGKSELLNGRIIFGTISHKGWFNGEHHTVKNMYRIEQNVWNCWFN